MNAHPPLIVGIDVSSTTGVCMKYALESLPELLGNQQFRLLLTALRLDEEAVQIGTEAKTDLGDWFATQVDRKAKFFTQKRLEEERRLSEGFEQRLRQVTAKPSEPVPASEKQQVQQVSADRSLPQFQS